MRPKHRALRKRLKDVRRELATVEGDLNAIQRGVPPRVRRPPADLRGPTGEMPVDMQPGTVDDLGVDKLEAVSPAGDALRRLPPEERSRQEALEQAVRERAEHLRDERFADYLATSFYSVGPLRHERHTQRNKAIVLAVLALIVLVWLAVRYF